MILMNLILMTRLTMLLSVIIPMMMMMLRKSTFRTSLARPITTDPHHRDSEQSAFHSEFLPLCILLLKVNRLYFIRVCIVACVMLSLRYYLW